MTPERAAEIASRIRADYAIGLGAKEAIKQAILQACSEERCRALEQDAARKGRGDPNGNWLMKPSLDWLENAEHGENQARCRMIAEILRDLWRGDDTLGAMPVAIDAAIKEGK